MMTTTFPKYESYKDSGVEWLGEIPSHWNIKKLKFCCKSNVRVLPENAPPDLQIQYVDIGSVSQGKIERVEYHAFKDAPSRARRLAQRGDTIISTVRTYLKAISYIEEEYEDCIFSTGFAVLNPSNFFDSKFFSYLLQSEIFIDEVVRYSKGVSFPAITSLELGNLPVSIPNIEEQKRIVDFLDRTTADIDRAIAQKQRLIELLKEQKAIVINQAVTKGLNPNAPMRDSGVQWLGEIPEHWEVWRSKRLFNQRKEFAQSDDIQLSATQAYGVIPQEEYEDRIGRKVTKIFQHLEKRRHVEVGDFVISMRSFQGGLERAWANGCIRSSYVVLKPSAQVDIDFFSYVFKSSVYISALQTTANFIRDGQDLNFDNFCAVDLALLPIEEQRAIAQSLNVAVADNAKIAEQAQKEIDLLREFRQIVIANAVTGKIKV